MKTARSIFCDILCAVLLAVACTACDGNAHGGEYPLGSGEGAFVVGLRADREVNHLHVFIFGSDGTTLLRNDYTDPRALASEYLPVAAGTYTVVAVANNTADNMPGRTTIADLAEWLKERAAESPDMLTASVQEGVAAGEVKRLSLTLQNGTEGLGLSTLRLLLAVPDGVMPPYVPVRSAGAAAGCDLRLTAEVYAQGSRQTCVHRRALLCEEQPDGTYLAELFLLEGDYDLCLWADLTSDGTVGDKYYNADDLTSVTVLTDGYVANGQTDEKDACYATASVSLTGGTQDQTVELIRPLARYRLVATDVKGYLNLLAKGEELPPIGDLEVSVSYEGFFPTGFDVTSGKPNDALTGIGYTAGIVEAAGYGLDEARQVGADFVLTNGDESSVTVTVRMIDRNTGKTVSKLTDIRIPYRRGCLTTVTGTFLTAGRTPGGVQVDPEWGDEIIVEF